MKTFCRSRSWKFLRTKLSACKEVDKDMNVVPEQTKAFYVGLLRNIKPIITLHYRDQSHSLDFMPPETFDLN